MATDTASSGDHCGRCGHSCMGGTCTSGRCNPALVRSGNFDDFLIKSGQIHFATAIYTTDARSATAYGYYPEAAPAGTAPTSRFTQDGTLCRVMTLDGATGDMYMQCEDHPGGPAFLYRNGSQKLAGMSITLPIFMTPSTSTICWINGAPQPNPGSAWVQALKANQTGYTITQYVRIFNVSMTLVAVDDASFFTSMVDSTGASLVAEFDLAAPTIENYTKLAATGTTLAASDGATLFYLGADGLHSTPKGTMAPTMVLGDPTVTTIFEIDGTYVYYVAEERVIVNGGPSQSCDAYRIARVPKTGGTEEVLVSESGLSGIFAPCIPHIRSDASIIAWSRAGSPLTLYKLAK
jgi:hypothetical protein